MRSALAAALLVLAGGCRGILGIGDPQILADSGALDVAPPVDVGTITPPQSDAPLAPDIDARECWGSTVEVCVHTPPTMSRQLTNEHFVDTAAGSGCDLVLPQTGGPDLCVVAAVDWTVSGLSVSGPLPLVLFAEDTISILGTIDVSGAQPGPDSDDPACPAQVRPTGSSGGAGASFGGVGGTGGAGANNPVTQAQPASTPTVVRGGCQGGVGGGGSIGGAAGGRGGGAIYLLAGNEIDLGPGAAILAGGAGGAGGALEDAGGGGGTGGFIGLEGATIRGAGNVSAPGGGGGEGGGGANPGNHGANATTAAGAGGAGNAASGGDGGAGGGMSSGVAGAAGPDSGGGGGGGAGVIWITGQVTGSVMFLPTPIMK